MYANGSSFTTSLTLQTPNTYRDVSFSSYLNKSEENMIRKLTNQVSDLANDHHYRNKPEEDEELGVFGAEKYFKGEIEDVESKTDRRSIDTYVPSSKLDQQDEKSEELGHVNIIPMKLHAPSVRSNLSCNSRIGLIPSTKQASRRIERATKSLTFLSNFGCNCMNKKSTQISESIKSRIEFDQKTDPLSIKSTERSTRNDYFSFPVLNSNSNDVNSVLSANSKSGNLAGKVVGGNNKNKNVGGLSLGRKLSLLNDWDVEVVTEEEMYIPSSGMYNNDDVDSDSSSDLFEIESFSTTGNNSFIAPRKSNCYAPSEVSVDWSVVTASAADFSVYDYDEVRTGWRINEDEQKKRPGILSGCVSHKAVRVAEVGGGGAGGRRRLSEPMTVGGMFRGGMI